MSTVNPFEGLSPAEVMAKAAELQSMLTAATAAVKAAKFEAFSTQLEAINYVLSEDASQIFLDPEYRIELKFFPAVIEVKDAEGVVTQEAERAQFRVIKAPVAQAQPVRQTTRTQSTVRGAATVDGIQYASYREAWDKIAASEGFSTPESSFNARARLQNFGYVCGPATR